MSKTLRVGQPVGTWTVVGTGPNKGPIKGGRCQVWLVRDGAGQEGVIKFCATRMGGGVDYVRQRFEREVTLMTALASASGVLPVLDVDPTGKQEWFVTQRAHLLADHFGREPDLWSVVHAFAQLADTLAALLARDVIHRDLKPANLFWLRGQALVGDFGIARHPVTTNPALTQPGNKVGPWGYIAPEALENDALTDWAPADVYSIAKCLWKIAAGTNYPPLGTLYIREEENLLFPSGGTPALQIARLLEVATDRRPRARPTMRAFCDELRHWLTTNPESTVSRPPRDSYDSPMGRFFPPTWSITNAEETGPDGIAGDCAFHILDPLRDLRTGTTGLGDAEGRDVQDHPDAIRFASGGDPEWAAEFSATKALEYEQHPTVRVIAQAFGDDDDATYIAHWQTRSDPAARWQPASPPRWAHGRMWMPSDHAARAQLTEQLRADDPGIG